MPTVQALGSTTELEAFVPEWWRLWRACPEATPFQSPAWLVPWWRTFGQGELVCLVVRETGEAIACMPLCLLPEAGSRKLVPVGIGISDYLDPLVLPGHEADAIGSAVAQLATVSFDHADLDEQRPSSIWLEARLPPGWTATPRQLTPCPAVTLPDGVPLGRLAKLPYYRRRAERLGPVARLRAEEVGAEPLLEALLDLHAQRWRSRGEPGVLADPAVRRFHRAAAPALLEAGLLRLRGLAIDGRLVAVVYAMADRTRWHAYIAGYDPELSHPGLGALLLGELVEEAVAAGARELHFLRGQEPYKYSWGAVDRPAWGVRLTPPCARRR